MNPILARISGSPAGTYAAKGDNPLLGGSARGMLLQVRRAKSLRTDPTYVESVHNEFVQRINTSVTWTDPRVPQI